MNLTCIWFVYQIAQNKCDKRIDIAAFLALKQIVDCSHPYSKYIVCIVMHSLLFSISIYNAAVKKMVTQESNCVALVHTVNIVSTVPKEMETNTAKE